MRNAFRFGRRRARSRSLVGTIVLSLASAVWTLPQEGPAAPLHYKLSQAGSVLRWDLPATLHTVHGTVPAFRGEIHAEPAGGNWAIRARIVVSADSMATGNQRRDRIMREKVLEAGQFPEIVFETTEVSADLSEFQAGQSFTAKVTGELTVHGKSLPVQLPVDVHVFPDHVILAGSFPLHWKKYGLHDPSFGLVKVKEPMIVSFRLRAVPTS